MTATMIAQLLLNKVSKHCIGRYHDMALMLSEAEPQLKVRPAVFLSKSAQHSASLRHHGAVTRLTMTICN